MKKMAIVIGLLVCLLSLFPAADVIQAKDLDKQAELLASCQKIQQYLTLPAGTSAEQRALVALNIAVAQSHSQYESADVAEVLRKASTFTTYLLTSDTFYLWSTDHWEGDHRSTYTYSGAKLSGVMEQNWDGAQWVNSSKITFSYDGNRRISTETDQTWYSGDWVNQGLYVFTYDDSGYLVQMLMKIGSGNTWVNSLRVTLTFSGGNLATVINENWWANQWVSHSKVSYTYSGGNTEWIMQYWEGGAWVNYMRSTYMYNGSGWMTQEITYTWQVSAWINSSKDDYTYDGSGNEILDVYSMWMGVSWMVMEADTLKWAGGRNTEIVYNHMIPPSINRTQYTYDGNGNNTVELGQEWSGSAWVNTDRGVFVYREGACGDCDGSGDVNIVDVVYLVAYIFSGGAAPKPLAAGDVDCSGGINIVDVVYLINYVFRGGPTPCETCP